MTDNLLIHELNMPVQYVKGVGEKRAQILNRLGIYTVANMLEYYPRDYQDRSNIKQIFKVKDGEKETLSGVVIEHRQSQFPRKRLTFTKILISDGTGIISLLFFNQHKIEKYLPVGTNLIVSGRVKRYMADLQLTDFEYEVMNNQEDELLHNKRIVPIYPLTQDVLPSNAQRLIRGVMKRVLDEYGQRIFDPLPQSILNKYRLIDIKTALNNIHFPENLEIYKRAKNRLVFEEFFLFQLALGVIKQGVNKTEIGIAFQTSGQLMSKFIDSLPFLLTNAQQRVIKEILVDISKQKPMHRLIHGDVGSGKTIVAIAIALVVCENGYQTAIMVPTEILAEQHYLNIHRILSKLDIKITLLTSSLRKKEKEQALIQIATGEANIIIGTHALIQEGVQFHQLGFCVIDEQHRFGVIQRGILQKKAKMVCHGKTPDVLLMTATPIPRTLAMTLYGDLDISCINEMPPNRQPVITKCRSEKDLFKIYEFIKDESKKGHQTYIVYPLIDESEELNLKAATKMFISLQKEAFPNLRLGLLHSKIKTEEKDQIMNAFYQGEIDVLISTTVIEVGIDVSNATVMLIEHAERFGLAQLHQLRGRIGRGIDKSYCILLTKPQIADIVNSGRKIDIGNANKDATSFLNGAKRIDTMCATSNGFEIAEVDLEIRGPGEFFGTKQHGGWRLKLANIVYDANWLTIARKEAFKLLDTDPTLSSHPLIFQRFNYLFKDKLALAEIG